MNRDKYLYALIKSPHTSEKALLVADKYRQYVFRVLPKTTKQELKAAVERIFEVKVTAVTAVNLKNRKVRNFRTGKMSTKRGYKKMYVTLAEGQQLDFLAEGGA